MRLLKEAAPAVVALGIGENGHLAFIDPPVCDFDDPRDVRGVELHDVCRMQQVHDGCFVTFDDVTARALSLTIPFFMRTPHAVVTVPGVGQTYGGRSGTKGSGHRSMSGIDFAAARRCGVVSGYRGGSREILNVM